MKKIKERAEEYNPLLGHDDGCKRICEYDFEDLVDSYMAGATEQKAIDHSEEHLNWIIKQHHLWSYEMCHCDNNECCTFKEWIDKAMEE